MNPPHVPIIQAHNYQDFATFAPFILFFICQSILKDSMPFYPYKLNLHLQNM